MKKKKQLSKNTNKILKNLEKLYVRPGDEGDEVVRPPWRARVSLLYP